MPSQIQLIPKNISIHIDISCGRLGYAGNASNVVVVMVDATMCTSAHPGVAGVISFAVQVRAVFYVHVIPFCLVPSIINFIFLPITTK